MFPFASGVSPLGDPSVWGGLWQQTPCLADLPCVALRADEQDAAVLGVGDRDGAVLEQVGVVRLVEIAGAGADDPGMAVRPGQLAGREGQLHDALVLLLVGDDPGAAVGEEGVVGEVEAAGRRRAGRGRDSARAPVSAALTTSRRLLPRSAISMRPRKGGPSRSRRPGRCSSCSLRWSSCRAGGRGERRCGRLDALQREPDHGVEWGPALAEAPDQIPRAADAAAAAFDTGDGSAPAARNARVPGSKPTTRSVCEPPTVPPST